MPSKVKKDLLEKSEIGQKLFETLVNDRNKSGNINLWSPMKKRKLQTWKTMGKKIKVSSAGLACVAGGISVEVLLFWRRSREKSGYSSQFRNFPSRLPRLAWTRVAAPPPKKYPGQKNPASYAGYWQSNSGVTRRLKFVWAHDGDMQKPTWDRHPRSCWNERIYSGTDIYVRSRRRNATMPGQKCTFVHSREASGQYRGQLLFKIMQVRQKEQESLSSMQWQGTIPR